MGQGQVNLDKHPIPAMGLLVVAGAIILWLLLLLVAAICTFCSKKFQIANLLEMYLNLDIHWDFTKFGSHDDDLSDTEKPHFLFWVLWVLVFGASVFYFAGQFDKVLAPVGPATRKVVSIAVPVGFSLIVGVPFIWRVIELIVACCKKNKNLTEKRRGFIAKIFFQILFLALGQMTVPLAQFCIDNMFLAEIPKYLIGLIIFGFIFIQLVAVNVTYYYCIRWISGQVAEKVNTYGAGTADKYQTTLGKLNTAAISLFDEYRWGCRFWMFFESGYDILNCFRQCGPANVSEPLLAIRCSSYSLRSLALRRETFSFPIP
jgi:hypothetical protein